MTVPSSRGLALRLLPHVVSKATSRVPDAAGAVGGTSYSSGSGQSGGSGERSARISPRRFRMNLRTRSVSAAAALAASGRAFRATTAAISSTAASSASSSQTASMTSFSRAAYLVRQSGVLYRRLGMAVRASTDGGGSLMLSKGLGSSSRWKVPSVPQGMNTKRPPGSR